MFRVALLFLASCLAGCATTAPHRPALDERDLLSAHDLFGWTDGPPSTSESEVLALDEEMLAFVREQTAGVRHPDARLRRLWSGMEERGLFALDYTPDVTRPVRETFHMRQGNCLSFTMLFVALAREAGLDANYQMVDMPPVWSNGTDVVIVSTHINVLVETGRSMTYIVDFNAVDFRGNYGRRVVSDRYALGLFYTNVGAEAFIEGDYERSFRYLRAGIETFPDLAGAWVNLGLVYSRLGRNDYAEAAYFHALKRDPRNRSAMTNLANLYAGRGDEELAQQYRARIRHYQERNPYYHYWLARQAYNQQRPADTLQTLRRALRLKPDEHQFHFLQALAHHDLGQERQARQSLLRARELVEFPDIAERYSSKLQALASH